MYKIIKLTSLATKLALCSMFSMSGTNSNARSLDSIHLIQGDYINIHLHNGNAAQAVLQLSQQTGQAIGYDRNILQLDRIVITEKVFHNARFEEVLNYILKGTDIQSKKVPGGIVLVRNSGRQTSYPLKLQILDVDHQPI